MNKFSSPGYQQIILILAGSLCMAGYGHLAIQSNIDSGMKLSHFLGPYWAIGFVLFLYWYYLHHYKLTLSYRAMIFGAVLFRIIGVAGSPILEDDFYRYLLDGCLFFTNGSPYGIPPESLFQSNTLSSECRSALTWVNNPELPTIYGPVFQYVFALAYLIAPANINVLQIILSLFDIGLILLLCRFASAKSILLYAWNPLVVKEIAFTAHPDIIAVFFLMAAFTARYHRNTAFAAIMIAFACASKIFAVLLLPYIIYKQNFRYWLLVPATIALLYLPFIAQGPSELFVLGVFAEHWQFNATVFQLFKLFFADPAARLACLGLFIVWWCYYFFHYHRIQIYPRAKHEIPRGDWIFGLFLLLSPVANPWYLIWLLPFAVLRPSIWAWTTSIVVSLSYVTGLNLSGSDLKAYEIANWALAIEIGAIAAALFVDHRRIPESTSES